MLTLGQWFSARHLSRYDLRNALRSQNACNSVCIPHASHRSRRRCSYQVQVKLLAIEVMWHELLPRKKTVQDRKWTFQHREQAGTTETKNVVDKLMTENCGMLSNREIRKESELAGSWQRNCTNLYFLHRRHIHADPISAVQHNRPLSYFC
jgi:hypothetical protein